LLLKVETLLLSEATTPHAVPSQCSIRVCVTEKFGSTKFPTAEQSEADAHATPERILYWEPPWARLALGEVTIAHTVPSQCSIKV
jgi:hypothetical protein